MNIDYFEITTSEDYINRFSVGLNELIHIKYLGQYLEIKVL